MVSTYASAVFGPTPGWVISNFACGFSSAACCTAQSSVPICWFNIASSRSKSSRRHAAQGFRGSSRRISDPDLMPHVLDQLHEPLTVARGLHTDQQRRRQLLIKPLGVAASMHQLLLPRLSRPCVQPTHLLPAGMEIKSYNHHRRLLS